MSVAMEPELNTTFVFYRTYKDIDDMILVTDMFWTIVIVVVVYLAFVLKIGPDYMKNRPPYQLKNTLLIYNLFQVLLSTLIVYLCLKVIFAVGIFPKTTPQIDPEMRKLMAVAAQVFYFGKFTELLDTVFFVFRKKYDQISFLHVYHHSSVIIGSWLMLKFGLNHTGSWGTLMNGAVHVAMYGYYFVAALGPQYHKYLTWKSYMTTFQIVQFMTVILHQAISLLYTKGEHPVVGFMYTFSSAAIFLTLFTQFYIKTYTKPKKAYANGVEDKENRKEN